MIMKDYAAAAASFKAALALNPDDPITNYNLGRAYQAMTPRSRWTRSGISPRR